MAKTIGVLTAGGDSPGLNAAIRGVGKAGMSYGMNIIGFRDGFRGLMNNRIIRLDGQALSGILTIGGTILGTSRDKPHKMPIGGGKVLDMTDAMIDVYHKHSLDALVCLGGGGTLKNAYLLHQKGLNVINLPKTIDNDVYGTDVTFGFDTALNIATEAIDRLHSTAHSHHRIIVVEIMGHNTGWLTLGSGIAGGADVILIPEIPYDVEKVAGAISERRRQGKHFSIVAVSEGAMSTDLYKRMAKAEKSLADAKEKGDKKAKSKAKEEIAALELESAASTHHLTRRLEELTKLESRVTILGHVQRGGIPSPADRLLATRLGTRTAELIHEGCYNVMVAIRGDRTEPVPLEEVVGKRKNIPLDHPWIQTARELETALGD